MAGEQPVGAPPVPESESLVTVTLDHNTGQIAMGGHVRNVVEGIGMLEAALMDMKARRIAERAAAAPRIMPGNLMPFRKH